jgi:acyl carrier protein
VETLDRVIQVAARLFGVESSSIGADVPVNEYGVDSLGLLELMFALEEEFQIRFPSDPSNGPQTIRSLARLVEELLGSTALPA